MNTSIRLRLALFGLGSMVLVGALAIGVSLYFFRVQIDSLYRQDFAGRIRGIEFEYADVDAVSAASNEVEALQSELLAQLHRRFDGEHGARPFIVNGSGQIILWPDDTGLDRNLATGMLSQEEHDGEISVTLETDLGPMWFFARYYPSWDWYTGYTVPEAERFALFQQFLRVLIAAILLAALLAFGLYSVSLRRLLHPLRAIQAALERYSDGDLRVRVSAARNDEIGRIGTGINEFADRLTEIIKRIRASSETSVTIEKQLSSTSREAVDAIQHISASTEDISAQVDLLDSLVGRSDASVHRIDSEMHRLTQRIEDQLAAVTESTASIEEMSGSLRSVASITEAKRVSGENLVRTAREGSEELARMSSVVQTLSDKVGEISEFVTIIKTVASQTNLLAMNAAIEAAHAGDAGRGFSVVAEEIRKLAETAADQSSFTASRIGEIVEAVQEASSSSRETQQTFQEMEAEISAVVDSLGEIASSTAELSTGSGEVMKAMQILQDVSGDVKENADTVDAEARTVAEAIAELRDGAIVVLRVSGEIADQAKGTSRTITSVATIADELGKSARDLQGQIAVFTTETDVPEHEATDSNT